MVVITSTISFTDHGENDMIDITQELETKIKISQKCWSE